MKLLFFIIITILLIIIININKENFKLEYNPNDLTRYINININKKISDRDFNTDSLEYYEYPFKCKEYKDITV